MNRQAFYRRGVCVLLPVCIALAWLAYGSRLSAMVTMSVETHGFDVSRYNRFVLATGGIEDAALEGVVLEPFARAFASRGWERTESTEVDGTVVLRIRPGPGSPMTEMSGVAGHAASAPVGCSLSVELVDRGTVVWSAELATSGDQTALASFCARAAQEIAAAFPDVPRGPP